ncbi:MAG: hypothetical protein IKV63_06325 [Clostridia bacterium]|nr:hypothetical protein [Clostridia bacterium]
MFRPDNVSEIRWAFYVKLFKFCVASVVVLTFITLFFASLGGILIGGLIVLAYLPCAFGYVLFHTYFAIQAEKNAPQQEEIAENTEK